MLETAKANISTFGIALTPCSLPGSKANFSLADDEMELGLGVHGENGIGRTKVGFFISDSKAIIKLSFAIPFSSAQLAMLSQRS